MTDELERLLSRPLAEIHDNGFSNRVAAQMELQRLRRERLVTEICIGLVVLAGMVLPFTAFGRLLAGAAFTTTGIALAGAALASLVIFSRAAKPSP